MRRKKIEKMAIFFSFLSNMYGEHLWEWWEDGGGEKAFLKWAKKEKHIPYISWVDIKKKTKFFNLEEL